MNAQQILKELSLQEKAELCSGADFWHMKGLQRFGLEFAMLTDGPHGLRKQAGNSDHLGINESVPATCFPTACTTACSFDRDLLRQMGNALGEECLQENVAVLLGPGANIKRSPLCGRNFEYISEDPFVTGELSAALINGIQEKGVGTSLKHFAANNQEKARLTSNSIVDERALREIYLAGFETAVKKSNPWTVMCSYNQLNGTYACENRTLLTDILRKEWGFGGLVVTDWGAMDDRVDSIRAGLDLEMPASGPENTQYIIDCVQNGSLSESALDECVQRVLELLIKSKENKKADFTYDSSVHHTLARIVCAQSAVLLKNDDNILPATPKQSIAIIGEFAKNPRYQGSGSSKIKPTQLDNAYDAICKKSSNITYAAGYSMHDSQPDAQLIANACEAAKGKDIVFVFAGLPDSAESEGFDRASFALPESHNQLISAVCKANPNVAVVLQCGSPVAMPWANEVKAILLTYLGGQASGGACADLLFGSVCPSGKLAETYPIAIEDTPAFLHFSKNTKTVEYRESIFVGYRWYDASARAVAFPFGYGLSYTSFEYNDLKLSSDKFDLNENLTAQITVTNTGSRAGAEVVQLYVSAPNDSKIFRAAQELKGFEKVFLAANESKTITLSLDKRSFAFYDTSAHDWAVENGTYVVCVGSSSRDIHLCQAVNIAGTASAAIINAQNTVKEYFELPKTGILDISQQAFETVLGCAVPPANILPNEKFTVNSTLNDIKDTPIGQQLLQTVAASVNSMGEEINTLASAMMQDMPLRALTMMGGGAMTKQKIEGILAALNETRG